MKLIQPLKDSGIFDIDPSEATALLEMTTINRPISTARVSRYLATMRQNKWKITGEPILIRGDGQVADGQHRLKACALSGKPLRTVVLVGDWIFKAAGQGKQRSAADVLSISKVPNAFVLASVARLCIQHNRGLSREKSPLIQTTRAADDWLAVSNEDIDTWVHKNDKVIELLARAKSLPGKFSIIPMSPVVACWYLSLKVAPENEVNAFYSALLSGIGLGSGDIRLMLRRNYEQARKATSKRISIRSILSFADVCKSWSMRADKTKKLFKRLDSEQFAFIR